MKRISHSFDERIANEPRVSLRDGHYAVFDGQHVVAARVDKNSGEELPICCKIYSDLTEQEEAKLFANQSGFGVPPSIGMKLRALVFAGDPEAVSFLKVNEEIGIAICDDEKRICAILAGKVGKICPGAEIMTYASGECRGGVWLRCSFPL